MDEIEVIRGALDRGLVSQNELAREAGVNQSTVHRIHKGKVRPLHENVKAVHGALIRMRPELTEAPEPKPVGFVDTDPDGGVLPAEVKSA
jgi:predicted transcriptional regulator